MGRVRLGARPRAVTLDDVARKSGVSRATASRALNGRERVNPDVRDRVRLIADVLGYRPNSVARSLASGRSDVLGLVLPTGHIVSEPYEAHLLEAVAEAATRSGHGLMLWLAKGEPSPAVRDEFRTGFVDGLIISGVAVGAGWVEDLLDGPHPCVLVGRHPTRTDVPSIEIDNVGGARRAAEHLVAGGSRRIAIVLGPADRTDSEDRDRGFRDGVATGEATLDELLVERGSFTQESGFEAMQRLLPQRPDGVFASNDQMAVGVLRAIAAAGLRVPDDIAVVGFDDLPVAATTQPPLTTIRHDIDAVGTAAIDALLRLLDREHTDGAGETSTVLPTPLIVRQSSRPIADADQGAANERGVGGDHLPHPDPRPDPTDMGEQERTR